MTLPAPEKFVSEVDSLQDLALLREYAEDRTQFIVSDAPWLEALRETGKESFEHMGFPMPSMERWKYTNLRQLKDQEFKYQAIAEVAGIITDSYTIVLDNGYPSSLPIDLPEGVYIQKLSVAIKEKEELCQKYLVNVGNFEEYPFLALNSAYINEGLVIHIAEGVNLERPIKIINNGYSADSMTCPRILLVLEAGAKATISENWQGDGRYFSSEVVDIVLKPESSLFHYRIDNHGEDSNIFSTQIITQEKNSVYDSFSLISGLGRLCRDVSARLIDASVSCSIKGGYLLKGCQHFDVSINTEHFEPECCSEQLFKGVLNAKSRAVFQGKIHVHRGAQGTHGSQLNNALLLSEEAEVSAKPELEIYNDDVVCSHGATVGQLDETALFYLQSRGIPKEEARCLLMSSFMAQLLETIKNEEIRDEMSAYVAERLKDINNG